MKLREEKKKRDKQSKRQKIIAMIEELIGQGLHDSEIAEKLKLIPERLMKYKQFIYDRHRLEIQTLTPEKVFTDYAMKSMYVLKEMDEAIKICREGNQLQAMVSAIWRKKEISDSVIKLGQDLGFIPKNAKSLTINNEISFSSMTTNEIEIEIEREKKKLHEVMNRKIYIRPEVAQFMDPDVRANLPEHVVLLDQNDGAPKRKVKVIPRRKD